MATIIRGREGELAELAAAVQAVTAGAGGAVVVEGMAGIGKSVLLEEVSRLAQAAGCTVAVGRADELDRITPMAALLRALRSGKLPALTNGDVEKLQADDQRLWLLDRLQQMLEAEAARRPLVVIIDDLHWADDTTLLAAGSLPMRLFSVPILWVFARRTCPSSPPLEAAWRRLDRAGAVTLRLGPISDTAVAAIVEDLVGCPPDRPLVRELERAAGNPFYLTQLVHHLAAAKGLQVRGERAHLSPAQVPVDLAATLHSAAMSLSEPARRLLQVGSVLGQRFPLAAVADLLGQPSGQLLEAVSECRQAEILLDDGELLAFVHDLLREAVYRELPCSVRAALHRDAAQLLLSRAASPVEVAPHLALSSPSGDRETIETLLAAARELLGRNPSAAADLALRAFDLLPAGDGWRAQAGALASDALGRAGRFAEAQEIGDFVLADHDIDPATEAIVELGIRRSWCLTAASAYPRPISDRLLGSPELPASLRACLLAMETLMCSPDDLPAAVHAIATIKEAADSSGADFAIATTWTIQIYLEFLAGHLRLSLEEGRRATGWAAEESDYSLRHHLFPFGVACALYALDRFDEAFEAFQEADAEAGRTGATYLAVMNEAVRSGALLAAGRLEDAAAAAQSACQQAEDLRAGPSLGEGLRVLGEVALAQGDFAAANECATRLRSLLHDGLAHPNAAWMLALLADATDGPDAAVSVLTASLDRLGRGDFHLVVPDGQRLPMLVALLLRAGRREEAEMVVRQAQQLAQLTPSVPILEGLTAHCRGLLRQDRAMLEDAVQTLGGCGRPLALATAWEDLAALRWHDGDLGGGVDALTEAFDISSRCGARRQAGRVRQTLRSHGVIKRSAAVARQTSGWESLTEAELTVAVRVAQGQRSKEVAEQLYLSTHTINTHLRHVFSKLGLRSRVELTRALLARESARSVENHQSWGSPQPFPSSTLAS
jgi:DNA-binding CsgD family transcriptional regulator/tetratricopeptide (TPR) repeat protein